jgi:hypothetical protein
MEGHVAHRRWKLIDCRIDVDLDEKRTDYATICCTVACIVVIFVERTFETNYLSNFGTFKECCRWGLGCLIALGKMVSYWEVRRNFP